MTVIINDPLFEKTLGNGFPSKERDVRFSRIILNTMGYNAGDEEFGYIDKPLDDAIRVFQRDNDLKSDGIIKPRGETENKMRDLLNRPLYATAPSEKPWKSSQPAPEEKPFPLLILDPDNGKANRVYFPGPSLVKEIGKGIAKKRGFGWLGQQGAGEAAKHIGDKIAEEVKEVYTNVKEFFVKDDKETKE